MSQGEIKKLFGTDGIRGVAGEFPLDETTVEKIGRALAANLAGALNRPPSIVIGRDTRESGPQLELALMRGAISADARVESAGVMTTPGVAYITRAAPFDAGVVISASHNPYRDNGIKVFTPSGKKLDDALERRIEADLAEASIVRHVDEESAKDNASASPEPPSQSADYGERYLDYLAEEVGRGLDLSGLQLAIDCANGAASDLAPRLFERLGAHLDVISASPDGVNINEGCGSLHLESLQRVVTERGLDMGIAFDGDADRALMADANGALVDGDRMMLILADHMKSRGLLAGNLVVATVMSNIGLEIALRKKGIELARAQVGDRYVLGELIERGGKLGGEQSGHIIFPDISLAGDGMITAIEVLRAIKESGRTLVELAGEMRQFPQVLVNVRVGSKPEIETLRDVKKEIEQIEREMQGRGRLLVRYSGTENLARVMIEGEDQTRIEEQANRLASVIKREIG